MLALHRAARAAGAQFEVGAFRLARTFRRDVFGAGERRGREVTRWQLTHALQHAQVRAGAQHAVLRGLRAQGALPQRRRDRRRRCTVGDAHLAAAAQHDGLEAFRAEHRTGAAASRLPPVVLDRRIAHAVFARCADRADAQRTIAVAFAQRLGRLVRGESGECRGIFEAHLVAVDRDRRPLRCLPGDHDRRQAAAPQHRREVARRQAFVEKAGQR